MQHRAMLALAAISSLVTVDEMMRQTVAAMPIDPLAGKYGAATQQSAAAVARPVTREMERRLRQRDALAAKQRSISRPAQQPCLWPDCRCDDVCPERKA